MDPVRIEARLVDRLIVAECDFRDKDNMKNVPGARWQHRQRVWVTPLSWAAMVQFRGVFGDRLEIGPKLLEMAQVVHAKRIVPALELREAHDADGDERLTPLQRVGAQFLVAAGQALLADPQGAGKTPMTILGLRALQAEGRDPFPCLVVCPNSVKRHWRSEFKAWWPDVTVQVIEGGAAKRRKQLEEEADVYVINWEALRLHSRLAGYGSIRLSDKEKELKDLNGLTVSPTTVIGDECHRAKDPRSKSTRALWSVGDRATFRFALTGTPIANSPADLWSVMRFVAPDEYPSKRAFLDRYGLLSWNLWGGLDVVGIRGDTREELFKFLDPRMIRRPKEMILPELPEKLPPVVHVIDLPHKQRKPYDQLRKQMLAELEGGILMSTNPAARIQRLRQFAFATAVLDENDEVQLEMPSGKIDEAVAIIGDEPDTKIAFFASTRKGIELLSEVLTAKEIEHGMITGGQSPDEREEHRKRFQDRKSDVNVILCTFGAGAEGIDLSSADLEVFLERDWSAVKTSQAEERAHRPGRVGPLRIADVVAHDTVDERVYEALAEKTRMLQELTRDEETLRRWLS